MQNSFKKQLFYYFVLPDAFLILILLLLILFTPEWHASSWMILSVPGIVAVFSIGMIFRLSKSFTGVTNALRKITVKDEEDADCGNFDAIVRSIESVAEQLQEQQEELNREKNMRIRSVIDGQDQERQRLSRELHDGLGQSLVAVRLQLENAGNQSYSQMRATTDVAKLMIDQTIDEVRRVTNALLPAALNEFGLATALRTRCEEMANSAGLELIFENSGSLERLEKKSKTYLYRIALEAITNVIKHARATQIIIRLNRVGQEIVLFVSDNGKGFIFEPASYAHRNGIQNIRERVALLNGVFDLKSRPNNGTTLKITIPYLTGNGKNSNNPGR
jgi:signal transduction histidine kinase